MTPTRNISITMLWFLQQVDVRTWYCVSGLGAEWIWYAHHALKQSTHADLAPSCAAARWDRERNTQQIRECKVSLVTDLCFLPHNDTVAARSKESIIARRNALSSKWYHILAVSTETSIARTKPLHVLHRLVGFDDYPSATLHLLVRMHSIRRLQSATGTNEALAPKNQIKSGNTMKMRML
eukprot:3198248-Amphidinium_carterae.2